MLFFWTSSLLFLGRARAATLVVNRTVELNNGMRMPVVGFGTYLHGGHIAEAVKAAVLEYGYRHIDSASAYGVEPELGEALAAMDVPREELWVTGKLPNNMHADVEAAVDASLQSLRLDYLDLYLVHWPVAVAKGRQDTTTIRQTWEAMEALVATGKVKAIGLSNFSARKIKDLLAYATIKPAVVQNELHVKLRQDDLLAFCAEQRIHVTAYAPLGSSDRKNNDVQLLSLDPVQRIANEIDRQPSQVLLRWNLQRGVSVIPKSTNPRHIASNVDLFDWALTDAHMASLSAIEPQQRIYTGDFLIKQSRGTVTSINDIWDED